ncbi:c-type cytochrome biogenesis protein CcmI [Methylovirgula sp. 4M-Z18]|uniref:c-type cytochrome biogenesis protein CcmI n=1 Tax=Methylovirgula sp. 4M-Z18 TaxID=2293567 RepID=UPI001AECA636|nr:c-type cytochrome biogenesis protein CcmI [Methylovirgula sp. 4M-Z18]
MFASLLAAAVLTVLWPLSRARRGQGHAEPNVAFYRQQVAEIDRDVALGRLQEADADLAKAEAGRRLLAAQRAARPEEAAASSTRRRRIGALAALTVVPVVSLSLYAMVGHPDMPDQPAATRQRAALDTMDVSAMVAQVEAQLAVHPDDGKGYDVLAPIYMRMDRFQDALSAYGNAMRLLGETAVRLSGYGEAQVYAAQGVVTEEARKSFDAALQKQPYEPRAMMYLSLAAEQDGNLAKALDLVADLLAHAPGDADWLDEARARAKDLQAKLDGAGKAPAAVAISALPPDQQNAAIHAMVDGLAQRLAANAHDAPGWLRLIRAYSVLQETDKAQQALKSARAAFAQDQDVLQQLDALARELGL